MFKKRYIYSSILSGIIFVIIYVILDFNILLSLLLTVGSYVAGILIYKEKDVRTYDSNIVMHHCYLISKIDNYTNFIQDKTINELVKEITTKSEKVVKMLEQKPNKVTQVFDAFDYYLPLTINLLEQYLSLKDKNEFDLREEKFLNLFDNALVAIGNEMNKLVENMNYTKMMNVNSSIEIFKKNNIGINENVGRE